MTNLTKTVLRDEARAARAKLKAAAPDAAKRVAENFLAAIPLPENSTVAGYIAAHDEIDPAVLIEALRERGHAIALPRIVAKDWPLAFHLWRENVSPLKGTYELFEAAPDWPRAMPAIVLVPLLAFDAEGFRLGYGGGYYDRSLCALREKGRVLAVGIAYNGQKITRIPHDAMDERLEWIVTEKSARPFGKIDRK